MATTDRTKIKQTEEGVYTSIAGIEDAKQEVRRMHSRVRDFLKTGTENAATNVAESPCVALVPRKSKARAIGIATGTNVSSDNSHYLVISFFKRANATSTLIGSWNTHGGAQGAITTSGPARIVAGAGLVTNSDAEITADSQITYTIGKVGNGQALAAGSVFSLDLEEI